MSESRKETPEQRARRLLEYRIGRREYSAAEVLTYLQRKEIDEKIARELVSEYVSRGIIDDARYARILVRGLISRGKGERYIAQSLRRRGVRAGSDDIRTWMNEADPRDELTQAREIVERRYSRYREDEKIAHRAFQALVRRGFSQATARRVIFDRKKS